MIKEFINKLLTKKKKPKEYRNADLYNILGQEYPNIMEWLFGNQWECIDVSKSHSLINEKLGTNYGKSKNMDDILYLVKKAYNDETKGTKQSEDEDNQGTAGEVQNIQDDKGDKK